jgi:predicted transcriptional regulator
MEDLMTLCRRYGYLDVLNPEPKEKREVAEALGKSPSTARKHLRELAESNVIERTEDGYILTDYGEVVRAKLREAERTYDAKGVIEAFDAPPEILSQGEFVLYP